MEITMDRQCSKCMHSDVCKYNSDSEIILNEINVLKKSLEQTLSDDSPFDIIYTCCKFKN